MTLKITTRIYYTFFILAIGAALTGLLFLHFRAVPKAPLKGTVLHGASIDIPVTVADTEKTREQGLSGTPSLAAASGMLFRFDTPGIYGFWMKDMSYPLDMVWLDENLTVVDITPDVAASTYPQIFYPSQPILYVLEVNADFSTSHELHTGQQFVLEKK